MKSLSSAIIVFVVVLLVSGCVVPDYSASRVVRAKTPQQLLLTAEQFPFSGYKLTADEVAGYNGWRRIFSSTNESNEFWWVDIHAFKLDMVPKENPSTSEACTWNGQEKSISVVDAPVVGNYTIACKITFADTAPVFKYVFYTRNVKIVLDTAPKGTMPDDQALNFLASLAQYEIAVINGATPFPTTTAPPTKSPVSETTVPPTAPPKTVTLTTAPPKTVTPTTSPPSTNGTIAGTVTSESSGAKIAGAHVSAGGLMTTTNTAGNYIIHIAPGEYTVMASAAGYTISSSDVTVSSGEAVTENIALTPAIADGDVNDDGGTNILDALFISQTTAGLKTMTPAQFAASDINSDGVVNDADALYISEFTVGAKQLQSATPLSASASSTPNSVSIGSATVPSGGTATVSIDVTGVTTDIAAATVRLTFDNAVVAVNSVDSGDLGTPTSVIDNSAGTVDISVFSTTPKSKTPVTIANVMLHAVEGVSEGTSPLRLTVQVLSDSNGNNRVPSDSEISGTATVTAPAVGATSHSVYTWGSNAYGQLGDDGATTYRTTPVQVSGLTDVTAIAGGKDHTIALKSDGTVWTWGQNNYGQLGTGTNTNGLAPVQVSGLTDVTAIAGGGLHTIALKSDGTVWTWGGNNYGQLGIGTNANELTPVQVSGLTGVTAIAGGGWHTVALKSDGTVWTWGLNNYGQLGDNSTNNGLTPVQVSELTDVTVIASGSWHTVALKSDGTVWAWGWNNYGQLGTGTSDLFTNKLTPIQVSGLTDVTAIAAGDTHTIALKSDGTVWGWGDNSYAELGAGTSTYGLTPVQVSGISDVTAIACGGRHTIALKSDGTVWTWGDFGAGQLGDGSGLSTGVMRMGPSGKSTPVQVSGLTDVTAIAGGGSHTIAVALATVSTPTTTARIESGSSGTSICRSTAGTDRGYVKLTASAGYIGVGQTLDFTASPLTPTEKDVVLRWWLDDHGRGGYLVPQGCTAKYFAPANIGTASRDFFDVAVAKDGQIRPVCFSSWCDGGGGIDRSYIYGYTYGSGSGGDLGCNGNVMVNLHPSYGGITSVTFQNVGTWLVLGVQNVQIGPVPKGLYTVWITTTTGEQLVANNVRVDCNNENYIYFK